MTPTARLLQFLGRCTCPIDQITAQLASKTTEAEYFDARFRLNHMALAYGGPTTPYIEITHAGQHLVDLAWDRHMASEKMVGDPLTELDDLIAKQEARFAA